MKNGLTLHFNTSLNQDRWIFASYNLNTSSIEIIPAESNKSERIFEIPEWNINTKAYSFAELDVFLRLIIRACISYWFSPDGPTSNRDCFSGRTKTVLVKVNKPSNSSDRLEVKYVWSVHRGLAILVLMYLIYA